MYEMLTHPVWLIIVFGVFVVGSLVHVVKYFRGLHWQIDRVAYREYPWFGFRGAVRSIVFWLVPFGTQSWRVKPGMTILFFAFHLGLIVTPLFLVGHTVVLKEAFGFYWPAMPNVAADALSWVVVITGLLLILRRYGIPEVRVLSTSKEYGLVLLAMAPFVTGLLAAMGGEQYRLWLTLHVLSGELWLLLIPFTRLSHAILFFCSRTQLGMDFGIKRGGMKNKGIAW